MIRPTLVAALSIALAATFLGTAPSSAFPSLSASADFGFGNSHASAGPSGTTVTSWGLGLGMPLGPASWIELRSTGTGGMFAHDVSGGDPGGRSVSTLTGGFQLVPPLPVTPFVGAGLGMGRAEIAGTRPAGAAVGTRLPTREHTGVAYSLAFGYRFAAGPGPTRLEVAYRTHGLFDRFELHSSDFARVVTLGLRF